MDAMALLDHRKVDDHCVIARLPSSKSKRSLFMLGLLGWRDVAPKMEDIKIDSFVFGSSRDHHQYSNSRRQLLENGERTRWKNETTYS